MNETLHYRLAQVADIDLLVENRIRFAIELNGEQSDMDKENLRVSLRNYFERTIPGEQSVSVLAFHHHNIAGIGTVVFRETPGGFKNPSGQWAYIMNMYTLPEFRRQGICSRILELLLEEGRKRKVTAFELHATEAGQPVYLKGGFKVHSEPTLRKFDS